MATPNYEVNYSDERFQEVESDKKAALNEVDVTYGNMISNSDKYYDKQIEAAQNWADKQSQLQQEQTDFTIEQIEQQKAQAQKDYTKEQSGAYVDWQKQSGKYGANAEAMAAQGMAGTGYSESSQVSMYNTYQNRVATARESYNQAVLNYNNAIKDARLQNNSVLAEIAYQALQTQLELSLEGFQYKNSLIIEQSNKKLEVDNMYYQRYQDVLDQINTENALAEEIRQYEQNYQLQVQEMEESIRQFNEEYKFKQAQYEEGIRQFNEEIARLKAKDAQDNALEIQKLELQKEQLAEEKRQYDDTMAEKKRQFDAQLTEEKRQYNNNLYLKQQSATPMIMEKDPAVGSESDQSTKPVAAGAGNPTATGSGKPKTTFRNETVGKDGSDIKVFTGSTYNDAANYLRSMGVTGSLSDLMSKSDWTAKRNAFKRYGTKYGDVSAAISDYETYADYLKAYVQYKLS